MNRNSTKILSLKPEDREEEDEEEGEDEEEERREEGENKPKKKEFSCSVNKSSEIQSIVLIAHVAVGFEVGPQTCRVRDVKD